ncbi:MAG: hypothetical protein K8J08_14055 [Thermoanaerobaculia bacterium]|nr:hypothetical protein [Thermoanaerobaculia bacterium]
MDFSALTQTEFLDFPSGDEIHSLLRGVDDAAEDLAPLRDAIASRLGGRTYERSAAAFLLIETIYDFEDTAQRELSYLLPRCVYVLTGDRDLALSALSAYNEIKDAFRQQGPVVLEDPEAEVLLEEDEDCDDTVPILTVERPDMARRADELLAELQGAQKSLVDSGLSARVSLDLTARRPTPERRVRTQEDLDHLRLALRHFQELIEGAEAEVLGYGEDESPGLDSEES